MEQRDRGGGANIKWMGREVRREKGSDKTNEESERSKGKDWRKS